MRFEILLVKTMVQIFCPETKLMLFPVFPVQKVKDVLVGDSDRLPCA